MSTDDPDGPPLDDTQSLSASLSGADDPGSLLNWTGILPPPPPPPPPSPPPLVFNDTCDTTNIKHVLLIDSFVSDNHLFYDSANADTFPIIYSYNSNTDELLSLLRRKFPASSIQRISLVFHDRGPNFMADFVNNQRLFEESDLIENQTSFTENVSFLISCINEFHVAHIDFLACNTLQYSNWLSYYALLTAQTSVMVGASNDATGNIKYGGDWILESTNEDIRELYFTENIFNYASTLVSLNANGATQAIYLQMSGANMQYSIGSLTAPSTWTTIVWPVLITNTNATPGPSNVLRVVATQALTMSATTGGAASGYFYPGSQYITFDGSGNTITISSIPTYPGFIQNGASTTNGYANIGVQNFTTAISGTSTLANGAGWLCQGFFGRGASGCFITNCTNSGVINVDNAGGIVGQGAGGNTGGSLTITNCTNSGAISGGMYAGGVAGQGTAYYYGSVTFTNCTNTGAITQLSTGGITGGYAGNGNASVTFTNCTNSGTISGNSSGGIAGQSTGYSSGSATFTSCSNTGLLSGVAAGGIVGGNAGQGNGLVTTINCFNIGNITGQYAGGIVGNAFAFNTSQNCVIRGCYNTAPISGNNAGGLVGGSIGFTNSTSYNAVVDISNCYSIGNISTTAGGICGGYSSAYSTFPTIRIANCYSSGTLVDANSGLVAISLITAPTNYLQSPYYTTTKTYVVNGTASWSDTAANTALTAGTTPASINTPGSVWSSIVANTPYVLSGFNAALYSPNSATSTSADYVSAASVFGSTSAYTYNLVSMSQSSNVLTMRVFVYKGTAPNYYSYNYNTFTLTNSTLSPALLTPTIATTTGVLTIPLPLTIAANGSLNSVHLQMSTGSIQYSTDNKATWTTIINAKFPVAIINTNPSASSVLNVVATQALTISNTYGNMLGYFIAGSQYITFDGSGNTITMNTITNYPGFIQNGGINGASGYANGYANVAVQNFTTAISGASTLAGDAGWLCQILFGRGVSGNAISGCTNSGVINGIGAGGIIGGYVADQGGSLTITNCTNIGAISQDSAGGIIGGNAARAGSLTITGCTNTGTISAITNSGGGILGSNAGNGGVVTITNCTNNGAITAISAGGIAGSQAGQLLGLVTLTNCYSTGDITGQYAGGIVGSRFAWHSNKNCVISGCYSTGAISGNNAGGITGAYPGYNNASVYAPANITITMCYSLGTIATTCGGICGGYDNTLITFKPNIAITNCYSSGLITSTGTGIVAATLTSTFITLTQTGTYIANNAWTDASANTALTAGTTPTNVTTNNPGSSWTSIVVNKPYVLSSFNAAVYDPSGASVYNDYTSAASVFGSTSGYTYQLLTSSQSSNVLTMRVFVYKGTSPNYYSYNSNTFTLTNLTLLTTALTPTISTTTGVLTIPLPLTILADGSGNSVYLQMSTGSIQYSTDNKATWGTIVSAKFPVRIINTNLNPSASSVLKVVATQALTISSTYGNTLGYFSAGSQYITFDGSGNTITISGITSYPGFIQNGTFAANGYANISVQNFTTAISGGSTLAGGYGWLCQSSFGKGASGNTIMNCTNNGEISGSGSGGITGDSVGSSSGSVIISGCANNGVISGINSGGIIGSHAGTTSGLVTLTNCYSTGDITGQYAGGITGRFFGHQTNQNCVISGCYSTGAISGNNAGGIVGASVGYSSSALYTGSIDISNCYSLGTIATTTGGICAGYGGTAYTTKPAIRITNCYSNGAITSTGTGMVAVSLTSTYITLTQSGTYIGNNAWSDTNAKAALTAGTTPTSLSAPGTTWTSTAANTPYILSSYNAAIYSTPSASAYNDYTSTTSVFGSTSGYTYNLVSSSQSSNVVTMRVFVFKGTAPKYYSYNYSTFTFTNSTLLTTTITPTINTSTGALTFPLQLTILADGSGNSVYLKMNSDSIQYSTDNQANWNTIGTTKFPVLVMNTNPTPGPTNILKVIATQALTISASTGGSSGYFMTGSPYITFDGSGNTITINTITSYLGFIQNGTSTTNGYANVVVQNFTTATSGASTLFTGAGWLCRQYFGRGASGNTITGCTNNGDVSGGNYAAGIAGQYAGSSSGSVTFTNCTNNGAITALYAGGITSYFAGSSSGSVTFTNCTNNGAITTTGAGGIAAQSAGSSGSAIFTGCTNTGAISGGGGGIAASNSGTGNAGSAIFTGCTNTGAISGANTGGIAGSFAGSSSGSTTFTGCTNTGDITSAATGAGGITGAYAGGTSGLVTITNCFSTGTISGQYTGGIAGISFAYNTSRNCVISGCYSTGNISGNNSGGIVGASIGLSSNALYTASIDISNCYSVGTIATTTGGICGGFATGTAYTNKANIRISNCYSSGTLADANSGLVGVSLTSTYITLTTSNTYIAAGTWRDASANAILTNIPTGVDISRGGITWTSVSVDTPYLLSSFFILSGNQILQQIYTPSDVSYNPIDQNAQDNFISTQGLYTNGIYSIASKNQVAATLTLKVYVVGGTSPIYYGYGYTTFKMTNTIGDTFLVTANINSTNGAINIAFTTPIYYISNLNPNAGEFGGAITEQPFANSTPRNLTIDTRTAQSYFKMGMSGLSGNNVAQFTFDTPDTTRSNEYIGLLASQIFGSSGASLFSNTSMIQTAWNTAVASALVSLNTNTRTNGASATDELKYAMLYYNLTRKRFNMTYGATRSPESGTIVSGTGLSVTGGQFQTGSPKVNVSVSGSTITNIIISQAGSGFKKGDIITITGVDVNNNPATIKITLNSIQAALLNGQSLTSSGIELPLETGDVIRVLFTLSSPNGQKNVKGDAVTITQTFYVNYTLN